MCMQNFVAPAAYEESRRDCYRTDDNNNNKKTRVDFWDPPVIVVGRRQVNVDRQPAVNHDWVNFGTAHGNGF